MSGPSPARSSGPVVLDRGPGSGPGEKLLDGRYRLQSEIAVGGMGRVWRAVDTRLDRPVAVKVLRGELSGDATFRSRFRTEARHAGRLSHPNIAAVHDYGETTDPGSGEPVAYLVMELVAGEPLAQLLQRTPVPGLERSLDIVRQTASALAAAHAAGVVHRDVKPANVLVASDGTVKLTDFGIAWSAADAKLTSTGHVLGTPHYLSPEQVQGERATAASDVYALGVVAYECLAGRRPFEGQTSVETALMHTRETAPPLPDTVPDDVRALVERAMSREVAQRPPDGAALRAALDALRPAVPAAQPAPEQDPLRTMALTLGSARPTRSTAVLPVVDAPAQPAGEQPAGEQPAGEQPAGEQPAADEPARGRRRTVVAMLGAAAAVALVLLVLGLVGSSSSDGATGSSGTPTAAPSRAATVRVSAQELIGQQFADVQAKLSGAGLRVAPEEAETTDLPAGQVFAVSPEGELAAGSTVTVTYAVAPAPTTPPPAPAAQPAAATSAAPSPQPAAPTAAPSSSANGAGQNTGHHGRNRHGKD